MYPSYIFGLGLSRIEILVTYLAWLIVHAGVGFQLKEEIRPID